MNTRMTGKVLFLGALLAALLLTSPALAADSADDLLQDAVKRYGLADFEGSLEQLNRARKATHDPRLLGLIHVYQGLNYGELDRLPLSRAAFTTALTHDPDICPDPARFKAELVRLCQEVRQTLRGTLAVTSEQDGAAVTVDGKEAGRTPLEVRVTIGSHLVLVQGPDGQKTRHEVTVYPDKTSRVRSEPEPAAASAPVIVPETPVAPPPGRKRLWTWVAAGSAVVVAAVGVGIWAASGSDYAKWQEIADSPSPTAAEEQRLEELEDAVKRKEVAAWVLFGTAGALAATSVVLFFIEGRPRGREQRTVQLAPVLGPAPGATLRIAF